MSKWLIILLSIWGSFSVLIILFSWIRVGANSECAVHMHYVVGCKHCMERKSYLVDRACFFTVISLIWPIYLFYFSFKRLWNKPAEPIKCLCTNCEKEFMKEVLLNND